MQQYPCELIRDLLPAYADGITRQETGTLIREHLNQCPDCASIYSYMRIEAPAPELPEGSREQPVNYVDYMKKLRTRRRICVSTILVAALLIATLWLSTVRKQNAFWSEEVDYVNTGTMIEWADAFSGDRTAFVLDGESYVPLDLEMAEDGSYLADISVEEAGPAFNICVYSDWVSRLINDQHRSTMYQIPNGTGCPLYYNFSTGIFYCREADEAELLAYYDGD